MRFVNLSHDEKLTLQKELLAFIEALGGLNTFYTLLENVREAKQHPLLNKTAKFHFQDGTISWEKEIFKEKIDTIFSALRSAQSENILDIDNMKLKKQVLNSIRVLGKLTFYIDLKKDDNTIDLTAFNTIDENNVELNPIFQILFFDTINNTKKILKYK